MTVDPLRALTVIALLASLALAALAGPAGAATPCWTRLLDDWVKDGRIDAPYPARCYRAAINNLPEDIRSYSSAREDIERVLREAFRAHGGKTPKLIPAERRAGGKSKNGDGDVAGPAGGQPPDDSDGLFGSPPLRPSSADSVPIPLLVLAGLALLLLASAAVAFAARRLQARRVRVAPLPTDTPPR